MTDWEVRVLYELFEDIFDSVDNVPEEILSVVNRTHEGFDMRRSSKPLGHTYSEDYDYDAYHDWPDAYEYMIVDRSV